MPEKNIRSLTKAITWRVLGTLDTIFLSYIIIGNAASAISIGAMEVVTKILWFFLHERLWNRVRPNHLTRFKSHSISFLKSISWRVTGTIDTIILVWFISGSLTMSLSVGGTELFTKILLYYLHERVWVRINWGKELVEGEEVNLNTNLFSSNKKIQF